jgi:hypothetical protein
MTWNESYLVRWQIWLRFTSAPTLFTQSLAPTAWGSSRVSRAARHAPLRMDLEATDWAWRQSSYKLRALLVVSIYMT